MPSWRNMAIWVSIASDAVCAAALQQAVEAYCIYDTITLKSVLQHDAAGQLTGRVPGTISATQALSVPPLF